MKQIILLLFILFGLQTFSQNLEINTAEDWKKYDAGSEQMVHKDGLVYPLEKEGVFRSKIYKTDKKTSATKITFKQTPYWGNWKRETDILPENLNDAPVLLALGPNDYWAMGKYSIPKPRREEHSNFKPELVKIDGYEEKVWTTIFPNQFDAQVVTGKSGGGYHGWHTKDMKTWVHYGDITGKGAGWTTTAEFKDGKAYIYYDNPNDQDPHLVIDENLKDGLPGKRMGMAFDDPSHGSDIAVIRSLDGKFHIIYEDWTPINARTHAWDSPLAGHSVSETGESDFKILPPAVDYRTTPTGEIGTYNHPNWSRPGHDYTNPVKYEIHEPEQPAFGDWAAISIGGRYYLFSDYDPVPNPEDKTTRHMSVGMFTSESIDKPFEFYGHIGYKHPDPDIVFAENKFYILTQRENQFISDGPWVEEVTSRVGVDTTNDGRIDTWTDWQKVKEKYDYIEGFSKQVSLTPASIDLSSLPAGYGFSFEFKVKDLDEDNREKEAINSISDGSLPKMDSVILEFK